MNTTAIFTTPKASGYLQQLCKHFAHKRPAEFDAGKGHIDFDGFQVDLAADSTALKITIHAEDPDLVTRGQDVIWRHLERFAFREDLPAPHWQAGEA